MKISWVGACARFWGAFGTTRVTGWGAKHERCKHKQFVAPMFQHQTAWLLCGFGWCACMVGAGAGLCF
jgi:hypothetical protein